jgi:hypothetical protein
MDPKPKSLKEPAIRDLKIRVSILGFIHASHFQGVTLAEGYIVG